MVSLTKDWVMNFWDDLECKYLYIHFFTIENERFTISFEIM